MQTLLTYLIWAKGASQMDCTSRLLFPSLGLRNKICAYDPLAHKILIIITS